ncbi:MAG: lysophospholipid acyltransferase family protein [Prevotella sp.]|nr:lysophospholipid acyltransferase family protein [Prevotella sp.]
MHRTLIGSLRWLDVRLIYVFTSIFIIPVCLLLNLNHSRTTAYRYFRQRLGYGCLRASWYTYVNHCLFAQVVVDRFAVFAGKRFKLDIDGYEYFQQLELETKGFVILSSHIGCYEVAGYSLISKSKRFNALVFGGEKATVMKGRQEALSEHNIRMIPVREDMSHLFIVNEALSNNEIMSMPADRIVGSAKVVKVNFFGETASLPAGPFSVATMNGFDALAVNVMKISAKRYKVYVTRLSYDTQAPRKLQMQQLANCYVEELERRVRQYPSQWFNFYDFWS